MPTTSQPPPTILSGCLHKMKRNPNMFAPKWTKRWVDLVNHSITWRHSQSHDVADSIDLSSVTRVYKVQEIRKQNRRQKQIQREIKRRKSSGQTEKNDIGALNERRMSSQAHPQGLGEGRMFVIKSSKRTLCLMAKCEEDCDRWVRGIQLQLDLKKKRDQEQLLNKDKSNRRRSGNKFDHMESILEDLNGSLRINVGRGIVENDDADISTDCDSSSRNRICIESDLFNVGGIM